MNVTIGIPFYNAEKYLEDAIKSILAQTYSCWELILIDDGSKDNSLQVAQEYAKVDSRIRVISDGTNKRLPYRLNQIISEAKGCYIARMDADDLIAVDRLEKQVNFLEENKQFDLVSTGILSVKNNLSLVGYRGSKSNKKPNLADAVLGRTGIIHASILAKKNWYDRNLYNVNNKLAEDYELWLNAYLKGDLTIGFIEEPLYFYREEQSIKLDKLITAYSTQISIIQNIDNQLLSNKIKNRYIAKIKNKRIIAKILFYTKMNHILHKRRVSNQNSIEYEEFLKNQIKMIGL
ncbi:MAG: glycosyltransferase family 2 protein [Acinetobacter sp.]|uniref:glycosyltransferase family 2 protein n=1 Tax=Acinetobacter sp. TaxID=472 RepID=UPI003D0558C9